MEAAPESPPIFKRQNYWSEFNADKQYMQHMYYYAYSFAFICKTTVIQS